MPELTPRRIAIAALVGWLAIALLSLASGPPLGHDEAAFATAANGRMLGWLYRSVGVIWVARVGVALGGSDAALRLASIVLGAGVVLATWQLGTRAFQERTGAWAAAAIATAHPMVLRSAELIGDIPATACVLAGLTMLVGELDRADGPRWRMVAAAPAFAGAFYLRYGSMPVIAIASVAAAVLWWRAIVRRPAIVAATAATFVALLVPHAVHSLRMTGRLFGILETSANLPRNAYVGEGLVTYLTSNPLRFYGVLVAPLAVLGLVGIVRRPTRRSLLLGAVAIGQLLAIGLASHAQPRYVFVATTLLVIAGGDFALHTFAARRALARAGVALVVLAWLGAAAAIVPYNRWLESERSGLVAAASAIRDDDAGAPCLVASRVVTQLMWYTGCDAFLLRDLSQIPPWPQELHQYVASVPHATTPIAPIADIERATATPLPVAHPTAQVWRLH